MDKPNGNVLSPSTAENGLKGKPPYSVETPYGFRLDLDFLKYVDDIEKGNTIKRVPIQRRSRAPRASTLPRHLSLFSGNGYRPSPWGGSTGALAPPRSRPSDGQQQGGYGSWALALSPVEGLRSRAELEASIRAFDEQPLGEHVRPHLLRASSLPLTVLLRKSSESTDDAASLRSSRDRLAGKDTSSEDVFGGSPDRDRSSDAGPLPPPGFFAGTLRRLSEALERVGELEAEARVIPELRAQICVLQEERERLRLGLTPPPRPASRTSADGTKEPAGGGGGGAASELKRPRQESESHAFPAANDDDHEWRTSTDLDELLTVTSLQAKVAALEQKLHESGVELRSARALLREQLAEGRRKQERLERLTREAEAGRPAPMDDDDETPAEVRRRPRRPSPEEAPAGRPSPEEAPPGGPADPEEAAYHVRRIQRLLEQQWLLLCAGGKEEAEGGGAAPDHHHHPDPKVTSLQLEMMSLVHGLSCWYSHGEAEGEAFHHGAPKSIMKRDGSARTSKNLHFAGVNEGGETTWAEALVGDDRDKESSRGHQGVESARRASPGGSTAGGERGGPPGAAPPTEQPSGVAALGRTDRGMTVEAGGPPEKTIRMDTSPEEQMEGQEPAGRETVSGEFMAACQFLKDHMDNMDNPNDEMRRALVVLFQHWFKVAAEEDSLASRVSVYLREVRTATPSLLPFLVNLADDNGNTALHYSVSHSNYGIVSLLLQTGVCEVDLQNKAGYTAVMLASLTAPDGPRDMEVVHRLMELGDVNARSSQGGQSALLLAVRHGRVVMVRMLLSCGADPNVQDRQGTTPLMCASERGYTHAARLLLDRAHCDISLADRGGRTALSIALQGSHSNTAALLQAHIKARGL